MEVDLLSLLQQMRTGVVTSVGAPRKEVGSALASMEQQVADMGTRHAQCMVWAKLLAHAQTDVARVGVAPVLVVLVQVQVLCWEVHEVEGGCQCTLLQGRQWGPPGSSGCPFHTTLFRMQTHTRTHTGMFTHTHICAYTHTRKRAYTQVLDAVGHLLSVARRVLQAHTRMWHTLDEWAELMEAVYHTPSFLTTSPGGMGAASPLQAGPGAQLGRGGGGGAAEQKQQQQQQRHSSTLRSLVERLEMHLGELAEEVADITVRACARVCIWGGQCVSAVTVRWCMYVGVCKYVPGVFKNFKLKRYFLGVACSIREGDLRLPSHPHATSTHRAVAAPFT